MPPISQRTRKYLRHKVDKLGPEWEKAVRVVLHHADAVAFRDIHDRIHLAAHSGVMYRHHRARRTVIAQNLGIDRIERRSVFDADEVGSDFRDAIAAETCSLNDRNDVGESLTGLNLERFVRERRPIGTRCELA